MCIKTLVFARFFCDFVFCQSLFWFSKFVLFFFFSHCSVDYILNVTREINNFFPGLFSFHKIRVYYTILISIIQVQKHIILTEFAIIYRETCINNTNMLPDAFAVQIHMILYYPFDYLVKSIWFSKDTGIEKPPICGGWRL